MDLREVCLDKNTTRRWILNAGLCPIQNRLGPLPIPRPEFIDRGIIARRVFLPAAPHSPSSSAPHLELVLAASLPDQYSLPEFFHRYPDLLRGHLADRENRPREGTRGIVPRRNFTRRLPARLADRSSRAFLPGRISFFTATAERQCPKRGARKSPRFCGECIFLPRTRLDRRADPRASCLRGHKRGERALRSRRVGDYQCDAVLSFPARNDAPTHARFFHRLFLANLGATERLFTFFGPLSASSR